MDHVLKESVGYFTSVVVDLNSGLPRTNPTSGHRGLVLGASELQVQHSNHSAALPPLISSWPHNFSDLFKHTNMLMTFARTSNKLL